MVIRPDTVISRTGIKTNISFERDFVRKMWGCLVVLAFAGVVSAIPGTERKTQFYDVAETGHFGATLSSYFEYFDKGEDFKFSEDFFKNYTEEKICEFVAIYKPNEEKVLQGLYIRAENLSDYDDDFFNAVRPFYDYVNSNDFYGLSPLVAQKIAPDYFNSPLKNISYTHYSDVDLERSTPLFFLVPKKEVLDADLVDKILIDDKRFCHTSAIVSRQEDDLDKPSADLKEDENPSNLAEEKKPPGLTEETKSSDLIEDEKPFNLAEEIEPFELAMFSDLTEGPPDLPEEIFYDPYFDAETSDISHEPPYGMFMRSDPIFYVFPQPFNLAEEIEPSDLNMSP